MAGTGVTGRRPSRWPHRAGSGPYDRSVDPEARSGVAPEILAYYERGHEDHRLAGGAGLLEFERTRELIVRYLPESPQSILDIGGGSGLYAAWLATRGHEVTLIDPVPLHIAQATALSANA